MERIRRIETWARLGYVARGIVYLVLGWIALSSGKALSTSETVQAVNNLPAGRLLLALLTVGLFGYGLDKIYTAALDLDDDGADAKGWSSAVARGIGGGWLLGARIHRRQAIASATRPANAEAGQATAGRGQAGRRGRRRRHHRRRYVVGRDRPHHPGRRRGAIKHRLQGEVHGRNAGRAGLVKPAGQIGYAARAIIVAMVGYFAIKAGIDGDRAAQLRRCARGASRRSADPVQADRRGLICSARSACSWRVTAGSPMTTSSHGCSRRSPHSPLDRRSSMPGAALVEAACARRRRG